MFVYKVEVGEEGRVIKFPLPGGVVRQVVPCPGMVGYCYCCTVILEGECVSMEGGTAILECEVDRRSVRPLAEVLSCPFCALVSGIMCSSMMTTCVTTVESSNFSMEQSPWRWVSVVRR